MDYEELKKSLLTVNSPKAFADLLNEFLPKLDAPHSNFKITERRLSYYLSEKRKSNRYFTFSIPKKSGEKRFIHAPAPELLFIQQAVKNMLEVLYEPHTAAFGFCKGKSIVDNAWIHVGRQFVFNIDLKDFFPSIEQGRVWSRLQHPPFNFNEKNNQLFIANIIANVCFVKQKVQRYSQELGWQTLNKSVLPQGAATSPLFSNIVSERLDRKLAGLAKAFGLKYSRYADDITFSSDHHVYNENSRFRRELLNIIRTEGFFINKKKVRIQHQAFKQEVTGLTVNEKVNVNRKWLAELKRWLYLWDRYGKEKAATWYFKQVKEKTGRSYMQIDHCVRHLYGQIHYVGMVKGKDDPTFISLFEWISLLNEDKRKRKSKSQDGFLKGLDLNAQIELFLSSFHLSNGSSENQAQL